MQSLSEHIKEREEKLLQPAIRTSVIELRKLLHKTFFEIGSSGRFLYKEGVDEEVGVGIVQMTLSDFELHPLSDSIVLATYAIYNHETDQHSLRSSIWKCFNGDWKMVFHQGTKVG